MNPPSQPSQAISNKQQLTSKELQLTHSEKPSAISPLIAWGGPTVISMEAWDRFFGNILLVVENCLGTVSLKKHLQIVLGPLLLKILVGTPFDTASLQQLINK